MIVRTTCIPRIRAFLTLYSQTPMKTPWPAAAVLQRPVVSRSGTVKIPKLPVPKLENTIEKFLRYAGFIPTRARTTLSWGARQNSSGTLKFLRNNRSNEAIFVRSVQPFFGPIEFERSRKIACAFASENGEGPALQCELEDRAACLPNWLEDIWLQTAYLGCRDSVVINSSPSLMLPTQIFHNESDRLVYTAKLIYGALQFHRKVYRHEIPVQEVANVPQDMTQFYRIFGTVRKPAIPIDKILFSDMDNQPQHICVVHNNNFYKMPVIDARGIPVGEEQILFMLRHVVENTREPGPPIGILTTADRDTWANAYKLLNCPTLKDNSCSLSSIESCLFLVCLDSPIPERDEDKRTSICRQLLHGGGVHYNSANRWFDKCIQFIVGAGGEVGLCYEHTPAEAIPVSMMVDDIIKHIATSQIRLPNEVQCPRPTPLHFQVDNPISCEIEKASRSFDKVVTNLDLHVFSFKEYGKEVPKKYKLSPDSYIQMAMQLAYFKLYCKPPPTYESASTRAFLGGRTETIRSCSNESKKFCELMTHKAPVRELEQSLRLAVAKHKEYTNEAMRGMGVDRHLLGLKFMADCGASKKLPEFFTDDAYVYSKKFLISSSQVGAADNCVMSYGPSEPNGYGVCYNPLQSKIIFSIACRIDHPETSSYKYAKSLEESLIQMENVLSEAAAMKPKL